MPLILKDLIEESGLDLEPGEEEIFFWGILMGQSKMIQEIIEYYNTIPEVCSGEEVAEYMDLFMRRKMGLICTIAGILESEGGDLVDESLP